MREPIAIDLYNQSVTGGVSKTLNSIKSDSDHVPCVICFRDDITIKVDEGGAAFTVSARDYKGVQCVAYVERDKRRSSDGD